MPAKFDWRALEKKWQKKWAWAKVYEADPDPRKPKYFVTAAYPYPNSPQHIGHARTYTLADVNARYHRMKGFNTLFPMGFHYTGAPLFAMSKRLSQDDPEIVRTFTNVYGIPRSKLDGLKEPRRMAEYFRDDIKKGMIEIGFSVDWRREFTTTDPLYTRFITWHFEWLNRKGLITRGTHPVAWCPNDRNPVGTVDTQGDIEPEIGESYLVKFERNGVIYPTATLRPETIFGVTNIWINPDAQYVRVHVDGEQWVVNREAVETLQHQNHTVKIEHEFAGKNLLWKSVTNPVTNVTIPILPGQFVEPDAGTGVVMSVPGHAPYDYQALTELKSDATIPADSVQTINDIRPISMIRLDGFSEYPAEDIIKKFGITGQKDVRLEQATKDLYSKEFHNGIMKDNTQIYAGLTVEKARQAIIEDLSKIGKVARLYEIKNGPITCRCGTKVVVHIVDNQWFINYGDPEWKKLAHQCLDQMTILPEERRSEFNYTIDWLRERACARKVGLGTRLPWDKEWTIEALSDSVIYMAYYVLAKYLSKEWVTFKKFERDPDKLSDSFFNYVFLGQGSIEDAVMETGISKRIVEAIRKEFAYFYPVDMRHSAKDLVSNHLTFYIFHHATLFPQDCWPKGIVANGFVLMEGAKMSKSLENIRPLREGIAKFGADPLRIGVLATAELNQDTDFSETLASSIQERLVNLIRQSRKLGRQKVPSKRNYSILDRWMLSRLNNTIETATIAMERLRVREVINMVLYQLDNDVAWYQRRLGPRKLKVDGRNQVLKRVMEAKARMLAPLSPHVAEEIWNTLGNKGMVVEAEWPAVESGLSDNAAEQAESIIRQTLEDTGEILKATGLTPKLIVYYAAAPWKWRIYRQALAYGSDKEERPGDFIKQVMADLGMREIGEPAAHYAAKSIQQVRQMGEALRKFRKEGIDLNEKKIFVEAADFFKRELKADVQIWQEGDDEVYDPTGRAKFAEPYRPAIFLE